MSRMVVVFLALWALGKDLRTALDRAYERVDHITFKGMQYRKDIGAKSFQIIHNPLYYVRMHTV